MFNTGVPATSKIRKFNLSQHKLSNISQLKCKLLRAHTTHQWSLVMCVPVCEQEASWHRLPCPCWAYGRPAPGRTWCACRLHFHWTSADSKGTGHSLRMKQVVRKYTCNYRHKSYDWPVLILIHLIPLHTELRVTWVISWRRRWR